MTIRIDKTVEDMKEAADVIAAVKEIEEAHSGNYALHLNVTPKNERWGYSETNA